MLASGNVVLDATGSAATVRKRAESALRETFGYEAWVLVYPLETVRAIADGYPFEPEVEGTTLRHLRQRPDRARRARGAEGRSAREDRPGRRVLYWQVPKTGTLDSTIGKTMGKKRYKSSTTTRNLRTLAKVLRG